MNLIKEEVNLTWQHREVYFTAIFIQNESSWNHHIVVSIYRWKIIFFTKLFNKIEQGRIQKIFYLRCVSM